MTRPLRFLRLSLLAGALASGASSCATAPKRAESTPRMQDSAPEKVAAQRAAAAHELQLEQDDERWGIDAARERKQQQEEAKEWENEKAREGKKGVQVTPGR
ncbi:MAG TPA: hypothetical protein VIF57_07690 [Polyangia bacterium]|jgi:hypothetical protein